MRRVDFPLVEQAYQRQQAQAWDEHFTVLAWRTAGYDAAFAKHLLLLVRLFNLLSPTAPLPLTAVDADQPHSFGGDWLTNGQDQGIYFRHASEPIALTAQFAESMDKQRQWQAFIQRNRLNAPAAFAEVIQALRGFLLPLLTALHHHSAFEQSWPLGGPWTKQANEERVCP